MQCNEIRNHFADYLAEDLDRSTQEQLSIHLKECSACRSELETLTDLWVKLGSVPLGEPASPDLDVRLRATAEAYERQAQSAGRRRGFSKRLTVAVGIAAAIVLSILLPPRIAQSAPAVLEDANGSRKIQYGEIVRSSDDMNAMLAMAGGARVEMRSMSELSLERAEGGVRIRLNNGGVIVDAAAQHNEKLYVQTKDVTASVGGAVSLVQSEGDGSQVGAIGGEVRVLRGTKEKMLRPGEQVSTGRGARSFFMKEALSWSSQAESHMAMLQQAVPPRAPKVAFDVASIRRSAAAGPAAPGARGGDGSGPAALGGCSAGSSGYSLQLDPRRLNVTKATLFQLIGYAYPVPGVPDTIWKQYPGADSCVLLSRLGLLPGGPDWIRTDLWDIEASIPEGFFSGRPTLLDSKLQQMLQTLLEERFKVVIRREMKEMPIYLLKVGKNGAKFNGPRIAASPTPLQPDQKPRVIVSIGPDGSRTRTVQSADGAFAGGPAPNVLAAAGLQTASPQDGTFASAPPSRDGVSRLDAAKVSIANWTNHLFANLGRPVIDRTGLTDKYDFHFDFQGPTVADVAANPAQFGSLTQSVNREAVKAMGFELEESRAPVEVWVIERAEKPSEN